jgi:LPXTG-motif cell wall-anchored protein
MFVLKRKLWTILLVFMFIITQFITGANLQKAEASSEFKVEVVINSFDKVIISGSSNKSNAFEALEEVLKKNSISYNASTASWGGIYIDTINDVKAGSFGGWDGWMYAVNRGGKYLDIHSGLDEMTLKNGDRLLLYYGDFNTLVVNKIDFSTKMSNESLEITLSNTYIDFNTNKPVVTPISGVNKVILNGQEYDLVDGKLLLPDGLSLGKHVIEISDFAADRLPNVAADKIEFEFLPEAYIRVEGLSGTITQGRVKGQNLFEMLENLLKEKNISYRHKNEGWGEYIYEIDGLREKKFGGWDGWLSYYKRGSVISGLDSGMDSFIPEEDDYFVVYYGDFSLTSYVSAITFEPEVVKENESFTVQISSIGFDSSWNSIELPIVNVIVSINGINYITDSEGRIRVEGLPKGEHAYVISGYNVSSVPSVVRDEGIFVIDNVNSPSFIYSPERFKEIDNSGIKKDIDSEISELLEYLKNHYDDPWAAVTLAKFGIKGGDSFIKLMGDEITESGIEASSNTDLEKLILNLVALGYNPYNFAGEDIIAELFNRNIDDFLINDAIFALIIYNYVDVKGSYNITKDVLIDFILDKKLSYTENGMSLQGWALSGGKVNPDITGAALSALAPYNNENYPEVQEAVRDAVNSLSMLQEESGYISDGFGRYSESLSFVIMGLAAVGENPEGVKFTKAKGDLVSALISFKGTEGQYKHALEGGNNYMATEQALRALYSLKQFKLNGSYDFYNEAIAAENLAVFNYTSEEIPALGAVIDNKVLIAMGIIVILAGGFLIFAKKKEK